MSHQVNLKFSAVNPGKVQASKIFELGGYVRVDGPDSMSVIVSEEKSAEVTAIVIATSAEKSE